MNKHIQIELVTGQKYEWDEKFLKISAENLFNDIIAAMENREKNGSIMRIETQKEIKIFNLSHIMVVSLC